MEKPASAIPWAKAGQWREVNRSIDYLMKRCVGMRSALLPIAERITRRTQIAMPLMDDLCAATCPWCPDPCCLHASIWWDMRDLLYLHLISACMPIAQPRVDQMASCACLGPRGCRLPRAVRPWICSWYLCPTQKAYARKKDSAMLMRLETELRVIQSERKRLENAFIRLTG